VLLTPRFGEFILGKDTVPIERKKLGRTKVRCGRVQKISPSTGFDHRTVHSVASRCLTV
jgi:hypothetical protein